MGPHSIVTMNLSGSYGVSRTPLSKADPVIEHLELRQDLMDHESYQIIQNQKQKIAAIQDQLTKSQMDADRAIV